MKIRRMLTLAMILVLVLVCPPAYGQGAGSAKEPPTSEEPKEWEFLVAPYIWMVSLKGDATVKGVTNDVNVSFFDIITESDFAFGLQGHFEAWYKRKWGMWFDGTWVVLSPPLLRTQASRISELEIRLDYMLRRYLPSPSP